MTSDTIQGSNGHIWQANDKPTIDPIQQLIGSTFLPVDSALAPTLGHLI